MTPRELAQAMATDMASGATDRLPRLTRSASPEYARDLLAAYYALRDAVHEERQDAELTLRERIAAASVLAEIEAAIDDAKAWLRRCARAGGRGVPALGCRGGAPAVDGPWMARSAPAAVGPARADSPDPLHNIHADPLFCASQVQELPCSVGSDNVQDNRGNMR